jgi:transcriptional regulator with PAS, ATPase and Fis domain
MEVHNDIHDEIQNMKDSLSDLRKNISLYSVQLNTIEVVWDNIPAILFFKDKSNNLVRVNDYFCKTMKCKREDVEGKNLHELIKNDELVAKYASNDTDVFKSGEPKLGIIEPLFDTKIKLRTDKFPIKINGRVEGVLGFSVIIKNKPNDRTTKKLCT